MREVSPGRRVLAGISAVLLLLAGCSTSGPVRGGRAEPARVRVVVDTDMGADDVLALLYLAGRRDVDLMAVTVDANGLARCPAGGRNARAVLAAAGRSAVPVACATPAATAGGRAFPAAWRDQADGLYGMRWSAPAAPARVPGAVDLVADALRRHPGAVLLALGPLTTVAAALQRPGVQATHPHVVVSGGAVDVPGNVTVTGRALPVAEWNLAADPTAASAVLRSGTRQTWITLDATTQVPVDVRVSRTLTAMRRNRAGAAALAFLTTNAPLTYGGSYFWDPVAATAVTDPDVVTMATRSMSIQTSGADAGRTVVDSAGATIELTRAAHPARFLRRFLDALSADGRAPAPVAVRPALTVERVLGRAVSHGSSRLPTGPTLIRLHAPDAAFQAGVLRMVGTHGPADVQRLVTRGVTTVPPWLIPAVIAAIPAGCDAIWRVTLPAGRYVVVVAALDGTALTVTGTFRAAR